MRDGTRSRAKAKRIVIAWVLLAAILAGLGRAAGMETVIPGPASKAELMKNAGERIAFEAGIPPRDTVYAVLGSSSRRVDSDEFRAARDDLVGALEKALGADGSGAIFSRIETAGHTQGDDNLFQSDDGKHLLILAETRATIDRAAPALADFAADAANFCARHPEFSLSYLSQGIGDNELFELIHRDLDHSLIFTLPITFAILILAFGSLPAALLPLLVAVVSLLAAMGISALLSHLFGPINAMASQLVVLLVLALGVDYSLFIVSRVREERRRGKSHFDAVAIAGESTGPAIVWSGLTVALSLFGLFLMNDTILSSMGIVAISAVLVTLAGAVLALPSLLLLGEKHIRTPRTPPSTNERSRRWITFSVRRPAVAFLFGTTAMIFLGSFALQLKLGSTVEPELLPATLQTTQAYRVLKEVFPGVSGTDFNVIVQGTDLGSLRAVEEMESFIEELQARHEIVRGPVRGERNITDSAARFQFVALGNPNGFEATAVIEDLEGYLVPKYFGDQKAAAYLSGRLPYIIKERTLYHDRTFLMFGTVLLLSMILLFVTFRSIVVPVKAVLLNILSTAASFGVLVLAFQKLDGVSWHYNVIESFVPALLFSILFGLSMDYHLLLLSRIREEVIGGKEIRKAVTEGILSTSAAINSAALIMVSVFAVIACLELPVMKELGIGLAAAVFLDATIIRTLLLPSSMMLLGRWNWYLPSCLEWLPRINGR